MSCIDVVVPVYGQLALTQACIDSVLAHSGSVLGKLIVVDDASPQPEIARYFSELRLREPRVRALKNSTNRGFVVSANLGLSASRRDVVVLNSDTQVTAGWLTELAAAFEADERLAALSPLSNNATMCSVPDFGEGVPADVHDLSRLDFSRLPQVTTMPTAHGFCLLLRRKALDEVGLFDLAYGRGYNEENDWCQRVRAQGYVVGRANRALVFHHGEASFVGARARLDVINARRLVARYPNYLEDNRAFEASASARVAARLVRAELGLLQVHVPDSLRTLAESLAQVFKVNVGAVQAATIDVWVAERAGDSRGIAVPYSGSEASALIALIRDAVGCVTRPGREATGERRSSLSPGQTAAGLPGVPKV